MSVAKNSKTLTELIHLRAVNVRLMLTDVVACKVGRQWGCLSIGVARGQGAGAPHRDVENFFRHF
jgi:hypothetical protein